MLYIYFEIRYYNQLMKIAPQVVIGINTSIEQTVHGNGGKTVSGKHPYIFSFNIDEIGATLGAARTLDFMTRLLEKNKRRIAEYTILCDIADNLQDFELFSAHTVRKTTADTGCFCTPSVYQVLRYYIECTRSTENSEWYEVGNFLNPTVQLQQNVGANFVISGKALCNIFKTPHSSHLQQYTLDSGFYSYNIPEDSPILPMHIYPTLTDIPFRSLREMLACLPFSEEEMIAHLTADEKKAYTTAYHCIHEYDVMRFESTPNPIFMQTLRSFFTQFLSYLNTFAERSKKTAALFVHSAQFLDKASSELLEQLFMSNTQYDYIYLFLMKDKDNDLTDGKEYRASLLSRISSLPDDLRNMFYLVVKSSEYLFAHEMQYFFNFLGKEASYLDAVCTVFAGYGLLENKNDIRSVAKNLHITGFQCDLSIIEQTIAQYLYDLFQQQKLRSGIEFYKTLLALGSRPSMAFAENAILKSFEQDTQTEKPTLASRELQLSQEYLIRCNIEPNSAKKVAEIYNGFRTMAKGDKSKASEIFAEVKYLFGCALCYFDSGTHDKSLQSAKQALQLYQDIKDSAGESRALQLIGNIYFSERRFSDAQDYLTYALHGNDVYIDNIRKLSIFQDLLAVSFMIGSYSETLRLCVLMYDIALQSQSIPHQLKALFIQGRCFQTCGHYDESNEYFSRGISLAEQYEIHSCANLCQLWKARSLLYTGNIQEAISAFTVSMEQGLTDAVIFIAEAATISNNDGPDNETIDKATKVIQETARLPLSKSCWMSGFSMLENRAFKDNNLIPLKFLTVFTNYIAATLHNHKSTALAAIHDVMRDAESVKIDPYASLYYYLYYKCMPDVVDAKSIDKVTILGRAFKCMQVVSANISDIMTARDYMSKSYWNSRIMNDAKRHMLF